MKRFIVVAAATLVFLTGNSFGQAFQNGDNVLSVGLGLGSSLGSFTYGSQTPAISLQYEHGKWDVGGPGVISLGAYLGYKGYKYSNRHFFYNERWNYFILGLRSAYHYNGFDVKELDVYGGAMLSLNFVDYSSSNDLYRGSYGTGLGFSIYLGSRYFLSENIAAFAELGYGISFFTLGAAFRL